MTGVLSPIAKHSSLPQSTSWRRSSLRSGFPTRLRRLRACLCCQLPEGKAVEYSFVSPPSVRELLLICQSISTANGSCQRGAVVSRHRRRYCSCAGASSDRRACSHVPCRETSSRTDVSWEILAITFTNKAAAGMREKRLSRPGELAAAACGVDVPLACAVRMLRSGMKLGFAQLHHLRHRRQKRLAWRCGRLDIDPKRAGPPHEPSPAKRTG